MTADRAPWKFGAKCPQKTRILPKYKWCRKYFETFSPFQIVITPEFQIEYLFTFDGKHFWGLLLFLHLHMKVCTVCIDTLRGKSLLESWVTTFLPDWQPPLIFIRFTSKSHEHYWHYILEHMHKKFEINETKIKGGCQSGRKLVTHNSKSDLPLVHM